MAALTADDSINDIVCRGEAGLLLALRRQLAHIWLNSLGKVLTKCQTKARVIDVSATAENASQMMTITWNFWN
jgi:hypothetical protein